MARALRHKETIMFSQGLQHFTVEAVVPEQLLHYVTAAVSYTHLTLPTILRV